MHTFYAPAERTPDANLSREIRSISGSPFIDGLMHSVSGLLAVLDKNRQIVALNDSLLRSLGVHDPAEILGLRPGEAVNCIHSSEEPGGCGTSKYCSTCGAAIAIMSTLESDEPQERLCALVVKKDGRKQDMVLRVQASPVTIKEEKYILFFLRDVSEEERRAALERTFFHDINNMLGVISGASTMLAEEDGSDLAVIIRAATLRVSQEVEIQRILSNGDAASYQPKVEETTALLILDELAAFFVQHKAAFGKNIEFLKDAGSDRTVRADMTLLLRVLYNMITNALEATPDGGVVKVWVEDTEGASCFCVWNEGEIAEDVRLRVFQRNFSTKGGSGRGYGTYSMKLFGEELLGGKVSFSTSKQDGTVFRLMLCK